MARSNNNLKAVLTDTANAIRAKTGSSALIVPRDFADEIANIPTGGGSVSAILDKTITEYIDTEGTSKLGLYAFAYCTSLTTASFPVCTIIGEYAFAYCYKLTNVSFPACTSIGNSAFQYCSILTTAFFPLCTTINYYTFANCPRLTDVSFPVCTTVSSNAFQNCSSLTTASFPVCTTIGGFAFSSCSRLANVSFPVCTTIGSFAFINCPRLTNVSFPACTSIGNSAFRNCYNLISLYLLGSSLCTLSNSYAFFSTPIDGYSASAGQLGNIYVPSSLYDQYISATNWAYFSDRFISM